MVHWNRSEKCPQKLFFFLNTLTLKKFHFCQKWTLYGASQFCAPPNIAYEGNRKFKIGWAQYEAHRTGENYFHSFLSKTHSEKADLYGTVIDCRTMLEAKWKKLGKNFWRKLIWPLMCCCKYVNETADCAKEGMFETTWGTDIF